jgi:hypothetical protein
MENFISGKKDMEDILSSNVFSFLKYSSRDIFLKRYFKFLGLDVSAREAGEVVMLFLL